MAFLPALIALAPLIPPAIQSINGLIQSFRNLGLSDEEIVKHLGEQEVKLDPLAARVAAFKAERHPDDKD